MPNKDAIWALGLRKGDLIFGRWDFPYGVYPKDRRDTRSSEENSGWSSGRSSSGSSSSKKDSDGSGSGGGAGALIAIAVALTIILITWGVSTIIHFALSRSREYLADAGSVELTKNPDALIRALRKISANPKVEVISRMEAFFIETPMAERVNGILSTHPHIDERIAALQKYAGAAKSVA